MKFKKSISLVLVMCMVLSLFASFVVSAEEAAEVTNIAAGKAYTTSLLFKQGGKEVGWGWDENASVTYPDEDGKSLTDGAVGAADAAYSDAVWAGFNHNSPDYKETGYSWITVDLGAVETINKAVIYVGTSALGSGIGAKNMTVEFFVSDDNQNWTSIGSAAPEDIESSSVEAVAVTADASGRYVQARMVRGGWMFVSEVEVYGISSTEEEPEEVTVLGVDRVNNYDWTEKDFASDVYTPTAASAGEIIMAVSAEGKTVADLVGGNWFTWWYKVLAKWDAEKELYVITAINAPSQTDLAYEAWTLGEGDIVIMCNTGYAATEPAGNAADAEVIKALAVGDTLALNKTTWETLSVSSGALDGVYLTVNAPALEPVVPEVPEEPAYNAGLTIELPEEVVVLGGAELDAVAGALTDGNFAEGAKDWQNTSGVYCFQNTVCTDGEQHPEVSLVYNFGEEAVVTGVKLGLYSNYSVMIGYPDAYIAAYVSEDGENWEFATGLYHELVSESETNGTTVVELVPYYALVGQYVKLVLTYPDSPFTADGKVVWEFVGVTEVAFETVSYDEGLTIELPEEVTVLGGAELDAVAGALTDGKWAEDAKDWQNTSGVYCFQNGVCTDGEQHPEISFVYNFGEVTEFNTVKLGLYSNYSVMIGYPDAYVYVYTSNNGADWEFVDAVSHELVSESETNGTSVVALTLADYAQAQYVKLVLSYPDSPFTTDGKVVWEFMGVTEVAFDLVINAQPDELVALPEGAPVVHLAGYTHGSFNYIMYADADMTFAELVTKYFGEAKDLNYFKVIVVNEDGTIDATYLTIGRPDGVKSDFTVKEGQLLLCLSANVPGYEVADTYKVGDIVTLYNINLDYLKKVEISGGVELTDAGFTVAAPQVLVEGVNQLTVPAAGSTVTLTNFDTDMVLTVEGLWSVTVVIDGIEYWPNRMGVLEAPIPAGENTVIFKNGDATAVDVYATVAAPVHGDSMDDPLVLDELGDITASVNDTYPEGVYYQYVATATGKLTLTIKSEGGWVYVINNLTAGIYGDMQWSDSDPVVPSVTIEVTEGDVIEFLVATYDPESPWGAPEGTVEFNVTEGEPTPEDPEADSKLSISDAIALGQSKEHNTYTEGKYYVTGVITEVYNTTYGNMKITDENGNILTIYGTYSADGAVRYDKLETKPVVGDTVTIYGIIGQYNDDAQVKNGWIVEHTPATPAFEEGLTIDIDLDLIGWLEAADLEAIKALLTDGKWAEDAKDWQNATGVVAIQNKVCTDAGINPAINLIWNFGEITKVNTVKLGLYANYNVMIGYPDAKIAVYTSADGKEWTEAGVLDTGLTIESATNGTAVVTLALDKAVETQFVKAVLVFSASPFEAQGKPVWEFIGLSEVEFSLVVPADPEADSKLSISDAIALGESKDHNVYTEGKYYVTGVITEVYNTTYGNMKITDENGNILTIYGTYGADGELRYDALEVKPGVGDTVTIYGIIGQYNGVAQVKNGWIVEHTPVVQGVTGNFAEEGLNGVNQFAANAHNIWTGSVASIEWWTKALLQWNDEAQGWEVLKVQGNGKVDWVTEGNQIVIAAHADNAVTATIASLQVGDIVYIWDIGVATSDKLSADVDCNGGFYTTDATKTGTTAFTYKEKVALAGDVNMDGVINDADYMIIRKLVVGTADAADYTDEQLKLADVNGNGAIDANDYLVVKRHALGTYVIPAWK